MSTGPKQPRNGRSGTYKGGQGSGSGRGGGRGGGRSGRGQNAGHSPPSSAASNRGSAGRGGYRNNNNNNPGLLTHDPVTGRMKLNGEKGASASSIDENYKIKFTNMLLEFREDEEKSELVLGSDLTNTERKFVHGAARGFGLTSKSKGKEPNRRIHVKKPQIATKRAGQISHDPNDSDDEINPDIGLPPLRLSNRVKAALRAFSTALPVTEEELLESYQTGSSTLGRANGDVTSMLKSLNLHRESKKRKQPKPFQVNYEERSRLYHQFQSRKKYTLLKQRQTLPAWNFQEKVVNTVCANQVTIISGDTGCGKSTQVPQFLIDSAVGESSKIAITQPRRISAISVAERVAQERGETIGQGLVGHTVRLDSSTTKSTQMVFMTPAILLKKLGSDPTLSEYTHVLLDEVHERDKFTEFVLIALKRVLLARPTEFKVVLMSATLQLDVLRGFYQRPNEPRFSVGEVSIPGRMFPVEEYFLEDVLEVTDHSGFFSTTEEDAAMEDAVFGTPLLQDLEKPPPPPKEKGTTTESQTYECVMCGKTGFTGEELGEHMAFCVGGSNNNNSSSSANDDDEEEDDADSDEEIVFDYGLMEDKLRNEYDFSDRFDPSKHSVFGSTAAAVAEEDRWTGDGAYMNLKPPTTASEKKQEALLKKYQQTVDDDAIDFDLILSVLFHIVTTSQTKQDGESEGGAVLIFLPGWMEISELEQLLSYTSPFNDRSKYSILSLHSGIPSEEQRKVFQPCKGRKIILSTNIAETSVTIPSTTFIIDPGKAKEKKYDPFLKTSTLATSYISKSSAKQRMGRAGRVRRGVCFHLFSRRRFDSLEQTQQSELLRTPLEEMILQAKMLGVTDGEVDDYGGISSFFEKAIDPPHPKSIQNAVELLISIGAMDSGSYELTDLGYRLAGLSVQPQLGKALLICNLFGIQNAGISLAAGMSYKSPFVLPRQASRAAADSARVRLSNGSESDGYLGIRVLNILDHMRGKNGKGGGGVHAWARDNFLSVPTLSMASEIRKNVGRELAQMGFLRDANNVADDMSTEALVQAALLAGFYPNLASRTGGDANFSTAQNRKIKVHISSVNALRGMRLGKKSAVGKNEIEFLSFLEMVKGKDIFTCQGTSAVHSVLPIILLSAMHQGGSLTVRPSTVEGEDNLAILNLDDFVVLKVDRDVASSIVIMRGRLNKILNRMLERPKDHGSKGYNDNVIRAARNVIKVAFEDERNKG